MTTSESKVRFFTKRIDLHNESNLIDSNRESECSTSGPLADGDWGIADGEGLAVPSPRTLLPARGPSGLV